jgi:NAD(P)-dependent dehydrogenase (short-subunit alcohol dehydrogenase family)
MAVQTYGRLDVLVNNAGILRDRTIANLSDAEWDDVIRVHLRGHVAPTRHAVAYWRDASKQGDHPAASVISTTSVGAFAPAFGQAAYTAAKLGIIGLALTVSIEAGRYGVRSNAISPSARTRMSLGSSDAEDRLRPPDDPDAFDQFAPENVSPLVGWLAMKDCPADQQIFHIGGDRLVIAEMPRPAHVLRASGRWTLAELQRQVPQHLVEHPSEAVWFGG